MKVEYIDFGDNNITDAGVTHIASMLAIKVTPLRERETGLPRLYETSPS
jgi:hypothetical protein